MKHPEYQLISHHLCPYVQRAVIVLQEQEIPFKRRNIDLANKPEWFLKLSPLGKVPLLLVDDDTVLFESAVIAEYLNEVSNGKMLAKDALLKARQRAWVEFASSSIVNIGQIYNAPDDETFNAAYESLGDKWKTLEANLATGKWFGGNDFSLVDAAFAPVFRYFDVIEPLTGIDFFKDVRKVRRWRANLATRPSVRNAVANDYEQRLIGFLANRDSTVGNLARAVAVAA